MDFKKRKLCFLDLETTGFSPQEDSIIEISFLVVDENRQIIAKYDKVTIPQKSKLNTFVSNLTGITQTEIDEKGFDLETQKSEIINLIKDAVIVGHNIDFDIDFLTANDMDFRENGRIDTHELSRILLLNEESYALEVLAEKYDFIHTEAHRAMSDVEASMDLYYFLLEKIADLPPIFLEKTQTVLQTKTDWLARNLFLNSAKKDKYKYREKSVFNYKKPSNPPTKFAEISENLETDGVFIRAGDKEKTAKWQKDFAKNLDQKSLIISPNLDFYPEFPQFPIPEILLDPLRLENFPKIRENLNNQETTFFLQIYLRHILGFRGKNQFDLFFVFNDFWNEVCCHENNNPVFQKIISERNSDKILTLTPIAFLRFIDLEIFQNRQLIIDEGEIFAEKLLFESAGKFSLLEFLDSKNEEVSKRAQFWVSAFCQEVIKPQLGHEITPFVSRVLLSPFDKFTNLAKSLFDFKNEKLNSLSEILSNPINKQVRWVFYHPKNGNLEFGVWHPDDWRKQKDKFANFSKIIFYRHKVSDSNAFFRIFTGVANGHFVNISELLTAKKWTVPVDLISNRSPDYNSFSAQKIGENIKNIDENNWLVVNFSSVETLKKVFLETTEINEESNVKMYGEKISGGVSKIFNLIKKEKKVAYFCQKGSHSEIKNYPFTKFIIQKIPFDPPHPLLQKIEETMKQSSQSFWDIWVMPKVSANLSLRTSMFPNIREIICFDGRENSGWGKNLMKSAFPEIEL